MKHIKTYKEMKRGVNLVQFTDLLFYAQKIGFNWNEAHKILVDDGVPPMYETKSRQYYLSDIIKNDYGWSEESVKIVKGFMELEKIEEMVLI